MDETLRNAMKIVQVRTYSGYRADQEPRTFILNGKEFKVDEVLSSYYRYDIRKGRLYRGYRVKADDGRTYELVHDEAEDRWHLKEILMESS